MHITRLLLGSTVFLRAVPDDYDVSIDLLRGLAEAYCEDEHDKSQDEYQHEQSATERRWAGLYGHLGFFNSFLANLRVWLRRYGVFSACHSDVNYIEDMGFLLQEDLDVCVAGSLSCDE